MWGELRGKRPAGVISMGLDRDLAPRGGTETETWGQIQETLQRKERCLQMTAYNGAKEKE